MKKNLIEQSPEEIFSLLLKRQSSASLKKFLEGIAKKNPVVLHQFIIEFISDSDFPGEEKYRLLYQSILALSNFEEQTFLIEIQKFIERAKQFHEEKNYLEAYLIASALLYERKPMNKEAERHVADGVNNAFVILSSISSSDAGYDLKEKIFQLLFLDMRTVTSSFSLVEKEKWLNTLLEAASEEEQKREVLEFVNERIGNNRSQFAEPIDEAEEEFLLQMKLQLLETLNGGKDILHFLESNKHIKYFRIKLIEEEIHQQNFSIAKELILEGKKLEERKGKIYDSDDYDKLLLKIALEENDAKMIRTLALQLFQTSQYDFTYFELLKQHYDKSHWKQQVDRIVNTVRRNTALQSNGIHAAAKILIEEEEWEKLLHLVQKNANLEFVEQYFDWLKDKFPHDLLEVYRTAIRRYAEKNMGPEVYRTVVQTLKKMQSLRGGREIVQSLAIELKVTYRQRKSFVEELNKIAL